MVDKKDDNSASNQNSSVKKLKVTTGAWWKSTVREEKKADSKRKSPAKEKTKARAATPKKRRSEKKKTQQTEVKAEHKADTKGDATETSLKSKAEKKVTENSRRPQRRNDSTQRSPASKKHGRRFPHKRRPDARAPRPKNTSRKQTRVSDKVKAPRNRGTKDEKVVFTEALLQENPKRFRRRRILRRSWLKVQFSISPLQAILGTINVSPGLSPSEKVSTVPSSLADKARKRTHRGDSKKEGEKRRGRKDGGPKAAGAKGDKRKTSPERLEEQEVKKSEGPPPVVKLLINAEEPEECRLALLEDGRLESLNVSTVTRAHTKNNIYKAKIVAIEPNLQAAFVDYGTEKNGFLPFSEIHPEYYKQDVGEKVQHLIDTHQWKKLSIAGVVEKGQEVLVQVVKEEVGKKGANMTTYLSLPGRCVVLMPGSDSTGISRKIVGEERRRQLREAMLGMGIPEGIGWIVRTASIDITENALSRDVTYLSKLWEEVKRKGQTLDGVGIVYQDQNAVLRFLREHFDPAIQEILVDDKTAMEQVKNFISLLPSAQQNVKVKLHRGARPIFNQFSVEDQIESIYQPHVNLPSGGSIVINPTEALVAIDVNSGSTSKGQNFEASIFQANMEAATELARQLRLRDLGGLVVVDFIDMRSKKHIREVEKQLKNAMRHDKAKVDMSRISKFGLMQISRQKLGAPIEAGNYRVCQHCKGRGTVRSVETLALFYLRRIQTGASRKVVRQVECRFPLDVAQYLLNNKRQELRDLELKYGADIVIIADPALKPADHELLFHKGENGIAKN